jgi:N utilization substance protein B
VVTSRRRRARDLAFQVLFQHDVGRLPVREALAVARRQNPGADWAFVESVVTGTEAHAAELDAVIEPLLEGWELGRLANVDRTILRLALYELLHMTTPSGVVINEAVELAKRYGTEASGGFVNGVLGAALRQVRPADSQTDRETAAEPRPASRDR